MTKRARMLVREARKAGLVVEPGGKHLRVVRPDGGLVCVIPTSKRRTGEYPVHRDRTLQAIQAARQK